MIKILKFNESYNISLEEITKEDISYIVQVFDEAISLCQIKNLEPGTPWRLSNDQLFVSLEICDLEEDDGRLLIDFDPNDDVQNENGIILTFIYDKNNFTQIRSLTNSIDESSAINDTSLVDFFEDIFTGIRRMFDEKDWGIYYEIFDFQTIRIYLFKKS